LADVKPGSYSDTARLQLFIDAVTDYAIYMLSPEGLVASWNSGAQRIKGYAASEIIGQHVSRFYTESAQAAGEPARALQGAAQTGKHEAEGWRVRKDGSRFWASVVIDAIRDEQGTLVGFVKIKPSLRCSTHRKNCHMRKRWTPSHSSPGASRMISTIC
jgi:PAS domain S-box-containing protein